MWLGDVQYTFCVNVNLVVFVMDVSAAVGGVVESSDVLCIVSILFLKNVIKVVVCPSYGLLGIVRKQ